MPPIWPVISTKGVHEAAETGGGPPQTGRLMPDNLPGQHAFSAFKQGTAGDRAPLIVHLFEALGLMVNPCYHQPSP